MSYPCTAIDYSLYVMFVFGGLILSEVMKSLIVNSRKEVKFSRYLSMEYSLKNKKKLSRYTTITLVFQLSSVSFI